MSCLRPNAIQRTSAMLLAACIIFTIGAAWPAAASPTGANGMNSAGQRIVCPPTIRARQVRIDAPAGWAGGFGPEAALPLLGAQAIFTTGSLRDGWGEPKDPPTRRQGQTVITTYPLPKAFDKWVVCHYGDRVYQALKLPGATETCA